MPGKSREPGELSADDARILALETPAIAGHTLKLIELDPEAEPIEIEELRRLVAARLDREPRARERIELAGDSGRARWVEDERFEVAAHVRGRNARERRGSEALWEIAGELMAARLDHRRPLWAFDLVGPFAGGGQAIVARIHHAMADGISCVRFLDTVLWDAGEPGEPSPSSAAVRAAEPPGSDRPGAASPGSASLRSHPGPDTRTRLSELHRLPGALVRELGRLAEDTRLDRPVGAGRELAFLRAALDELKRIGHSRPLRATVNDVLLAAVAGGLRRWLGGEPSKLRAQVPVSLHHRDEDAATLGNRDSYLNVDLPVREADPLARLDQISAETAKRKRLDDAEELLDFFHALSRCGPVSQLAERFAEGPREFTLSISNVPGPRDPLSVAGRRVQSFGSFAEPADRHALRVSAISYDGEVGIGLCADPSAIADLRLLVAAIEESLAELRGATIE